jgi:hypothetical protein
MALYRIDDFDPDYKSRFSQSNVKTFDLYSRDEKVGSVDDVLVDQTGHIRYLVINTGLWIFGKKTLLPIGQARFDYEQRCIHADHLTKAQVESLPEFTDQMVVDFDHEELVRRSYRHFGSNPPASYGIGYSGYESAPSTPNAAATLDLDLGYAGYDRDTYTYDHDPALYEMNEQNHLHLKRYQDGRVVRSN